MNRIVIAKRWTGFGDCIVSLLAAFRFARQTGRTLIADWRFSAYAPAWHCNSFALAFEPQPLLGGVPFLGDDRVNDLALTGPFHPTIWDAEKLHLPPTGGEIGDEAAAVALIGSGSDVAEPVVVFDTCLAHAAPSPVECRRLLGELRPQPRIVGAVEAFAAEHFAGRSVVGVHVRHGNGGNIMGHAKFWTQPARAIGRVIGATQRAVRALKAHAGIAPLVFVCTDSPAVEAALRIALPEMVTRPKTFRERGRGELHLGAQASALRDDALVEMFLLARCDVLVRFPPGSFFSFWGAVMKCPSPVPDCGPPSPTPAARGPAVC